MDQPVRVLIADDQVHIRQALQALLTVWPEIEVTGLTANSVEVVHLVEECQPHVVLMDIRMPVSALSGAESLGGLEAIRLIKKPVAAGQDCDADDVHDSLDGRVSRGGRCLFA